MLKEAHLPLLAINPELKDLVAARLESGNYTDAILSAFRHLTNVLRKQSGEDGDGAQLVGKALGGSAPEIRLNSLQIQSELDEQKGMESL